MKLIAIMEQLQIRLGEIAQKECELENERDRIMREIKDLKEEERRNSPEFTQQDRRNLYMQLSALSKAIIGEHVLICHMSIVYGAPRENEVRGYRGAPLSNKYSIDVTCTLINEYGGPGFTYNVTIRTKNPHVMDMIRECFEQKFDYPEQEEELRTHWWRDWDYGTCFAFKDPKDAQDLLRLEDTTTAEVPCPVGSTY